MYGRGYGASSCRLSTGAEVFWVGVGGAGVLCAVLSVGRLVLHRYSSRKSSHAPNSSRTAHGTWAEAGSLYGPLLDAASRSQEVAVDSFPARWHVAEAEQARGIGEGGRERKRRLERRVDWWISFAAAAEALYAVLFLALAIVFSFHVTAHRFSWLVELCLVVLLLAAKLTGDSLFVRVWTASQRMYGRDVYGHTTLYSFTGLGGGFSWERSPTECLTNTEASTQWLSLRR